MLDAINDAEIDVYATTDGHAIKLIDQTNSTDSNLIVEQLGDAETAADLGLWGTDSNVSSVTGSELLEAADARVLQGVALDELAGGTGLAALTTLDITLSDGTVAAIDLSGATTTSEILDAINAADLPLIAKLNDSQTGFRLRDVSGGTGNFTISSVDDTAAALGVEADTSDDIVVGRNLNRQTVTADTLLSELSRGEGVGNGSFTITDSNGNTSAVNIKVEGITTVGELIDALNNLGLDVSASLNDAGDGIAIVDTGAGPETLTITESGSGTTATRLGIAGQATTQTVGGNSVSALVGSQSDSIEITADDSLASIVEKINASGRYADASVGVNDDGSFFLNVRSNKAGAAGVFGLSTAGFSLDLRTSSRAQDAIIAVSTDGASERIYTSADGVFDIGGDATSQQVVTSETSLASLNGGSGIGTGSFTITDSDGNKSAVNILVQQITTVGGLVDAINDLGIGVSASINEAGDGIAITDTADGAEDLTIADVGTGLVASRLGIAGKASERTIDGSTVNAIVGRDTSTDSEETGLVFTLKQLSADPITVTVAKDTEAATSAAKTFVEQFNLLVDKLDSLTAFNPETNEVGLLFGSSEAIRISSGYSRLLSGRINAAGNFKSLGQVGLRLNDQGKLELDESKLQQALDENPADVEAFFTTDNTGLSARLNSLADRIAGESSGMLLNRNQTLTTQIESNSVRIDSLSARLEKERDRLLAQFYATEEAIGRIQADQSAIASIQPITIPT